jgi:hypothetical protein
VGRYDAFPMPMRCSPILVVLAVVGQLSAVELVEFNRQVRPLLSDRCFHCHGPDAGDRKAGLRLDLREEALKPAESGAVAVVPGKPDESELLKRIELPVSDTDAMPPAKAHKPGWTAAEREVLRLWISQGAWMPSCESSWVTWRRMARRLLRS